MSLQYILRQTNYLMPHEASSLLDSILSPFSLSSQASVELYEERIKPRINTILNSGATLQELVDTAEKIVNDAFTPDPKSTFTYKKPDKNISVQLDKVMIAMLSFAEECGGESGKRYVAAAIFSCSKDLDVVGALAALGTTWLTHFLFVFQAKIGHTSQPSDYSPPAEGTPTVDQPPPNLEASFSADVMRRDGYECVLTGAQDLEHPDPAADIFTTELVAARILRRAVGHFGTDYDSASYKSAVTTFDILRNFTRLPAQTLEELSTKLDDPSNGMTLDYSAHSAYDRFDWCLKKTEIENTYHLKIFRNRGIMAKPDDNRITFTDRSNPSSDSTCNFKGMVPVNLPNAHYIEIHAAVAEILHVSGAGKFFDELLGNIREYADRVSTVRCWLEMEKLMEEQLLRDNIAEAFQMFSGMY